MGEKTIYFKDLNGLIVVCYERQEFDAFHDIIWTYDVVVKAQARIGAIINYILARDIQSGKIKKTILDVVAIIKRTVTIAIQRSGYFIDKLREDTLKLEGFIKDLKKGDYYAT